MNLQNFKDMIGILGNFSISDRMFKAIDTDKDGLISLEDYLVYNDILTYGNEHEKNFFSFKMIDLDGDGIVNFEEFKNFWFYFIELYSEAL